MPTAKSKGPVRRIIEDDGEMLVSFPGHDGYFRIAAGAEAADIRARILEAQATGAELAFAYDETLSIVKIL